jgi:hypothetical protein
MGLLDDAIREHLDLKRRRGADPADVARLEQEALGPVRREPAPAEAVAEPAAPDPHADEHAHALAPEERHDPPHGDPLVEQHAHDVELGGAAAEPEPAAADADRAAAHEPEPEATGADRAGGAGETIPAAPPAESSSPATGPARHAADPAIVDQPTTEYRVEDHHDDEGEHGEPTAPEDVLEETPDFLQETPEHDRLWFEQRPPRDFDFDG